MVAKCPKPGMGPISKQIQMGEAKLKRSVTLTQEEINVNKKKAGTDELETTQTKSING